MPDPSHAELDAGAVALYGRDEAERIVGLHLVSGGNGTEAGQMRVYRRVGAEAVEHEDVPFYPFFFLADVELLRDFPRERFRFQELSGEGYFRWLVVFTSRGAYWDAVRHIERVTETAAKRPDEVYFPGPPEQQYLMQTGRTLFKGMHFDELHRLQLDIEVYASEGGFPNAERAGDEVIIVSLSDNRGWTRLLDTRSVPERVLLQELVRLIQEKDPDVIEGHNCFPAGTPILTPDGYQPIEALAVGDEVLSWNGAMESDCVTAVFETAHDGDLLNLHAVYRGKIVSTPDHPHFGYTKRGGVGYHAADAFEVGDYLALPTQDPGAPVFDEAFYLAGLVFADGHLSKTTNRISFGNTDRALVDWVAARVGGRGTIRHRPNLPHQRDLYRLRTHDAALHSRLQTLGIPAGDKSGAHAEIAVERIAVHGLSAVASFLAGVIDGDGHVSEANGAIHIACRPERGKSALLALAHHLGLVAGPNATGLYLWPTATTVGLLRRIQSWLRVEHKRRARFDRTRRRVDELPFHAVEILRPFIERLGLRYQDFPVPTTTVNYYLNGRTSIHRDTFARFEATVDAIVPGEMRAEWERAQAQLDALRAFHWFPIRKTERRPHSGPVYNIETGNHNYVAGGVLTHNCYAFDFPYLMTRCDRWGVPFAIGRDGSVPRSFPSSMRFAERSIDFPALDIAGRHVIDTYFQVMSYDVFKRDLPAYGLKAAAKYFGFAPEGRTYVPGDEIPRVWDEDPERLLAYALDDVIETERLSRHLSGSTFYLTQMVPMPYDQCARTGPAAKIESLFVREYLRQKQALPKADWGSQVVGGYTDVFVTGVVGPVVYADVESLYPSIMLNYDVQPAGDTLGLFPGLLRKITALRFETKARMRETDDPEERGELDARQTAYKNIINCFDGATDVLTVRGVKPIADIEVGDEVYALDPETLSVEVKPVVKTFRQVYDGPMVRIRNRHVDYLVTPHHKFLTSRFVTPGHRPYAWEVAGDFVADRVRRKLPPLGVLPGRRQPRVRVDDLCRSHGIEGFVVADGVIRSTEKNAKAHPVEYVMEDWLARMGWFIAEGHVYRSTPKRYANGNRRGVYHMAAIGQKREDGRAAIADLLDRMGIGYSTSVNGLSFCSRVFCDLLEAECGSGSAQKRIPPWVFALLPEQLQHLFDALMAGDGDRHGKRYTTKSRTLADDFIRLSHHLGLRAFVMSHDGTYCIAVNRSKGITPMLKGEHRWTEAFEGEIYCVEVADHHTLLAGRNGKLNWCGQSFYGNMGFGMAIFNDFAEADRVASVGQDILRRIIRLIRERGGTVVEVDTDGVLFVPPDDVRGDGPERAFVAELNAQMPEGIRIGFDGRFQKMLSYKKKNYALQGYDGSLTFKGSSLVSRSSERFGRRFLREAIPLLLGEDIQGLHDLYLKYRDQIVAHDWEGVQSFQRTETIKDSVDQYKQDVADGKRTRAASYELAIGDAEATGRKPVKGDRISYYLTGTSANVTAFESARLADDWDPADPDENTAYYLKRLDEFAAKFAPFFAEHDFRLVFSPEDLFGFDAAGITLRRTERAPDEVEDDVPF